MRVRAACLLLLAVAGCESVMPAPHSNDAPKAAVRVAAPAPQPPRPALEVMQASAAQPSPGEPSPAVAQAPPPEDGLTLVAKCFERNDLRGAAAHLDAFVQAHPDQPLFRLQLAELYSRCELPHQATFHYERFAADAQAGPAALQPHLVTAHIKLMEVAQKRGDRFGELYHRGVGLLLLVKQQDGEKDRDATFCEEMTCKALAALAAAKELKPGDPRVRVYLAEVHERMGNRRAAGAERAGAKSGVVSGELTASERKGLPE